MMQIQFKFSILFTKEICTCFLHSASKMTYDDYDTVKKNAQQGWTESMSSEWGWG